MEIKRVKITQVKINEANPRQKTEDKFRKLVNSILVFPSMLEVRPIAVDDVMVALGGNMRLSALREIAKMDLAQIEERLGGISDYQAMSPDEQSSLKDHWAEWLTKPTIPVADASTMTKAERDQFIIKDNVAFGSWDYPKLSQMCDEKKLADWGMDMWQVNPTFPTAPATNYAASEDSDGHELDSNDDEAPGFEDALPPELQGIDLTPNELPKLEGSNETPSDYVLISYSHDELEALAEFIGIPSDVLSKRIVWSIDDISKAKEDYGNSQEVTI